MQWEFNGKLCLALKYTYKCIFSCTYNKLLFAKYIASILSFWCSEESMTWTYSCETVGPALRMVSHMHMPCAYQNYMWLLLLCTGQQVCNRILTAVSAPVVSGTPQYRDPQWKITHFRYDRTRSLHLTKSVFMVYRDKNDNSVILHSALVMSCAIFLSFVLHRRVIQV